VTICCNLLGIQTTIQVMDDAIAARRPLKSRQTRWAAAGTAWLSKIGATPNGISLFSMVCATLAGMALVGTIYTSSAWVDAALFALATLGIQARLLCNLFDGMVAVEGGKRSAVGELFNETPDRVADTIILVCAGYAAGEAWGPTLGWVAALFAMATAYVRVLGKACGAGTYFIGPMAKQHRMAVMTVACITAGVWAVMTTPKASHQASGCLTAALVIICLGSIPTLWRRLSRISRDLHAKGVA
jgi:phosphatidylglycerophosphate synthase